MAKSGVLETGSLMADSKALELKKELQRLVRAILDDDDFTVEDEAVRVLSSLKELKLKKSPSFKLDENNPDIPEEFKCPISKELMKDPVVLATGLTYDRPFIERWLNEGHQTCPQTQQVLPHTVLTPNHLVQEMISQWCTEHGYEPPKPTLATQDKFEKVVRNADGAYLNSLLEKMCSSSLADKKEAAKELRMTTKRSPSFRELFAESGEAISKLLNPLSRGQADTHSDLQEDLITTLLNLSICEKNKKLVGENPLAINLLVESLKSGTTQTRSNAAAAIFTLSDLDSNKLVIGNAGAIGPLIDLLEEGNALTTRDAASAIFSLCLILENKRRVVQEGAVSVIVKKIKDHVMVAELLAILALLSVHQKAVDEMDELNVVPLLLSLMREISCENSKENCIAILYTICYNDRVKLREIKAEEAKNGTISRLARSGTSRARRKASGILERLNRYALITHTA